MGRRGTAAAVVAAVLACLGWISAARAQDPVAGDFQKVTLDDNTQNPMELNVAPKVTAPAGCGTSYRDDFDGTDLDAGWDVVRRDQGLVVSGGTLKIPTAMGDVYAGDNNAKNIVLRAMPSGPWTMTTKIKHAGNRQYHQAGLIVYGDDDNYTKFDRLAVNQPDAAVSEHFEFINEVAGTPRNSAADSGPQLDAAYAADFFMKIESDGTQIRGYQSLNGTDWTLVGQPANLPTGTVRLGMYSLGNAAATTVTSEFDWFTLTTPGGGSGGAGDDFTGTSLDKTRWNAIVREDPSLYTVADGSLTITTTLGDLYATSDSTASRNLMLQTADHASADYVLETKLSGTIDGGYGQGGILVYTDDNNYVKLDAIADAGNTRINRLEFVSEVGAVIQQPTADASVPAGTTNIWLRLTKTGTTHTGEYSYNGTTWTPFAAAVTNAQTAPRFGLYTLGVQTAGDTVTFDYFKVDGSTGCGPANASPVITSATATPTAGIAPLTVDLAASATDADGDPLTYSWDFDSNGSADATGATASTTFNTAGNKTVTLTVKDGRGGTATRDIPVQALAADDPSKKLRALVFSKTAGFRHDSIGAGIAAIQGLGQSKDWQVDATEDASLFTDAFLSHYDVVVFMSTTGDTLNDTQQAAFERFIRSGKGYVGIHAAADGEYDWRWYGNLVGAYFRNHPAGTPQATVVAEDTTDPSTEGLPARWTRTDEWYNYKAPSNASGDDYSARSTPGVHVLLKMDESTYAEDDGSDGVDDDHPISWCQRYDGGRSWYTGMGHSQQSFSEPGMLSHIGAGIEIAAGVRASASCGNRAPEITSMTATPPWGVAPLALTFAATATDADGDAVTYSWDLDGNGSFETNGETPSFTYTTPGLHSPVVRVTDAHGASATQTLTLAVSPPPGGGVDVPGTIGGNVQSVLALTLGPAPSLGAFIPAVDRDYTASLAATVTSTASAATLSVRDPSTNATGRLVNGNRALTSPLQMKVDSAAFAPLPATGAALALTSFGRPVGTQPVRVDVKQSVSASERLLAGSYGKTVVFTLSTTTP